MLVVKMKVKTLDPTFWTFFFKSRDEVVSEDQDEIFLNDCFGWVCEGLYNELKL